MTDAPKLSRRLVLLAAPALTLAGCGSLHLLEPSNEPGKMYVLSPNLPSVPGHSTSQIAVAAPEASASFTTTRIAIRRGEELDFYADAQWTDGVPQILQALFVQALEKNGATAATDVSGIRPDFVLQSEVRAFEARYSGEGAPTVVVEVMVRLMAVHTATIVASRLFHQEQPASANNVAAAVAAFDQAVSALLQDVVRWVIETLPRR